jgi:hypothetical protein
MYLIVIGLEYQINVKSLGAIKRQILKKYPHSYYICLGRLGYVWSTPILTILFRPFRFIAPKHFKIIGLSNRDLLQQDVVGTKFDKKSLKIPKGWSKPVNLRRTDNTMAKRKRTNNDLQNIHWALITPWVSSNSSYRI